MRVIGQTHWCTIQKRLSCTPASTYKHTNTHFCPYPMQKLLCRGRARCALLCTTCEAMHTDKHTHTLIPSHVTQTSSSAVWPFGPGMHGHEIHADTRAPTHSRPHEVNTLLCHAGRPGVVGSVCGAGAAPAGAAAGPLCTLHSCRAAGQARVAVPNSPAAGAGTVLVQ